MTATGKLDIKDLGIAAAMLVVLCGLAVTGRMKIADQLAGKAQAATSDITLSSPYDPEVEPVRADVVNDAPWRYTLDIENLANIGVSEDAPAFAIYTGSSLPDICGDFREDSLSYSKPSKYQRRFNLSRHRDVLEAIDLFGCIIVGNADRPNRKQKS